MSFKHSSLRVLNPRLPIGARFNAFIECCSAFGRLARTRMQSVYDHLGTVLGFDRHDKPSEDQQIRATSLLIAARFRLIHERAQFAARRKKLRGEMKRAATEKLYDGLDPVSLLAEKKPARLRPGQQADEN